MSKRIDIAGVRFDPIRYDDVLMAVEAFVHLDRQHMIVTPNPEMVVNAQGHSEFRSILNHASLSIPDGIGILWAAYYLSLPKSKSSFIEFVRVMGSLFKVLFKSKSIHSILPQRVTGSDLLLKIVDRSQQAQWRIFLLGAAPGVAEVAVDRLLEQYPQSIFAGTFAGTPEPSHEDDLVRRINLAQPDILFVAYGSPAQEEWIARNLKKLNTTKVVVGVGGAIDFAAGRAKRAPQFMQKIGLEWLWRLVREPRRIKRIWTATVVFVRMIVGYK